MKIHIPLFLVLLLGSCKPSAPQDTQAVSETKLAPDTSAIPFAGNWLNETYYKAIMQNKSPRAAQELVEEVFIQVPARMNEKTEMIYGFHESGPELQLLHHAGLYTFWELQGDTLDRKAFDVKIVDSTHLQIGDQPFVRIYPLNGPYQPLILEEILFKGTYKASKKEQVEFKNNGQVVGLGKYKYYTVLTDYMDAGLQIDQVGLGETMDKWEYYGFKFKPKGLELYEIKCKVMDEAENRCVDVDFGKLAYSLEHIK